MARAEGDIVITVGGNVSPLTDAVTKAERTLGKLNTATQRADKAFRAMVGTSTEMQSRIDALSGVTERTGKSAERAAKAFEGFEKSKQAIDRLRASYDPLFAASRQYEAAVEQLDDALSRGVITQSQYADMSEKLAAKLLRADAVSDQLAAGMGKTGGASSRLTMQIQNASYQVGDFAVQIASGTDATRALAQQLPQLLGGFGMFGAVAGAAVAIGGALAPMFIGTSEKAKDSADALTDLSAAMDAYNAAMDRASATTEELIEKYGGFAGQARELSEYASQIALGKNMEELRAAIEPVKGALSEVQSKYAALQEAEAFLATIDRSEYVQYWSEAAAVVDMHRHNLEEAAVATGLNADQALQLAEAMDRVAGAQGMAAVSAAAADALRLLRSMYSSGAELPGPLKEAGAALERIALMAAQAATKEQEMHNWATKIKNILSDIWNGTPGSGWLSGEISDAAKLAQNLWDAAKAKAAALAKDAGVTGFDDAGNPITNGVTRSQRPQGPGIDSYSNWQEDSTSGGRSGGGGGSKDDTADRFKQFNESLMTEAELELQQHELRLQQLKEFEEKKLLTQEEAAAKLEDLQRQHQQRMSEIDVYRYGSALQIAGAFFGDMASALQGGNEKMQKIAQKFGAVEALINAWRAYNQTLADPSLPFMAKFAAGAKVLAAGFGAVNAIKGAGKGGGGGGSSGGTSAAAAAAPLPVQRIDVAWNGPSESRTGMQSLLDQLNELAARGYRVDARLVAP